MRTLAKFEKVSFERYAADGGNKENYGDIILPARATALSAGYDFFAPERIELAPQETVKVATGIRVFMPDYWALLVLPRSGLGFRYRLKLDNTVGVIDADYCLSENEGHIFVKITNEGTKAFAVEKGVAFAQGIFIKYGLTEDDAAGGIRNGGMGSTDKTR